MASPIPGRPSASSTDSLRDRHFVWIMGADNMVDFHRWERWRDIAAMVPIAVYVRPGSSRRAPASRAATALARYRIDEADAGRLASLRAARLGLSARPDVVAVFLGHPGPAPP